LNGNTFISTAETLIIQPGQQLRLNNDNAQPPQYYTLTNNGAIILNTGNSGVVSASINTYGSSPNYPNSLSNPSGTITCNSGTNLLLNNGMINGGTININGGYIWSTIGNFINNNGIININKGSFNFSGLFSNIGPFGTINNEGNIIIGTVAYNGSSDAANAGTLINQNGGTITNQKGGIITIGALAGPPPSGVACNGTFINQSGGTVTNNGTITKVPGFSTFTNDGTYYGFPPV
jgi:hypothetical protein